MTFIVVWEFWVKDGMAAEFERAYGADGAWARLFAADPAFIATELVRDPEKPARYFTLDRWESEAAYDAFRAAHESEYSQIDAACAELTEKEMKVGSFIVSA